MSRIAEIIDRMQIGNTYTLGADAFEAIEPVKKLLRESFGVERLAVTLRQKDVDKLTIQVDTVRVQYLSFDLSGLSLTMAFAEQEEDIDLSVTFNADSISPFVFITDGLGMPVSAIEYTLHIDTRTNITSGDLKADLTFNQEKYPVEIGYITGFPEWYLQAAAEKTGSSLSLAELAGLLGISEFITVLPDPVKDVIQSLSLSNIQIVFNCESKQLISARFNLKVSHSQPLVIFDGFEVDNLFLITELKFEDKDRGAAFTLGGTFTVLGTEAPIQLMIGRDEISVLLKGDKPVKIGSLECLAAFIGRVDIHTLIPADCSMTELYLDSLGLTLQTSPFRVSGFILELILEADWNILDNIKIEQIQLTCGNDGKAAADAKDSVVLIGTLSISDVHFGVEVEKSPDRGWEISGYTLGEDTIHIARLLEGLSLVKADPALLPQIDLSQIFIGYTTDPASFELRAQTAVAGGGAADDSLKFRSLTADFRLRSEKTNGEWSHDITIKGEAELLSSTFTVDFQYTGDDSRMVLAWKPDTPFSLTDFCRAIGFASFAIPEELNIAATAIEAEFDFKRKDFKLTAETSGNNKMYIHSMMTSEDRGQKRVYVFGLSCHFDVGLDQLPVVGSSTEALRDVRLHDLVLLITSDRFDKLTIDEFNIKDLKIDKGLFFTLGLKLPDQEVSLNLPLPVPAHADAADGGKGGLAVSINKNIGPFSIYKLHLAYENSRLWLGLDAGFAQSVLSFTLDGLSVGYGIKEQMPSFNLEGLSLDVRSGPLTIGGSFLHSQPDEYSGTLLIGLKAFNLTAVGSYTAGEIKSIFALAILLAEIGGPPCFFVTGIAAGLGYNRRLQVPDIAALADFPLMKAVRQEIPASDIWDHEERDFPAEKDANWFAAGVLFNSFKMVDSFALLTVMIGKSTEINLLGQATINIPFNAKGDPIAHAVLMLKASIKPESSLVAVEAALADESYILSRACRLTGSFAFYAWYGGEHAGDFVVTLGGYSDIYKKPPHYPDAKRLGLSWAISDSLSAKGSLYFALTPSAVMAGGVLKLLFTASRLEAWFDARLDILLQWKPYSYDFSIGIHIGVKVATWLFTVRLELGCDLQLWGPEFSGIAKVKLWCISFSIPFGNADRSKQTAIDVKEFVGSFLPAAGKDLSNDTEDPQYGGCSITAAQGLSKEYPVEEGSDQKYWLLNAEQFEIITKSTVPATAVSFNEADRFTGGEDLVLRPCGNMQLQSTHAVQLKLKHLELDESRINLNPVRENVPAALWASSSATDETVLVYTGLSIQAKPHDYYTFTLPEAFVPASKTGSIPKVSPPPGMGYDQQHAFDYIADINKADTQNKRNELLAGLGEDFQNISLGRLADAPSAIFIDKPIICSMGSEMF